MGNFSEQVWGDSPERRQWWEFAGGVGGQYGFGVEGGWCWFVVKRQVCSGFGVVDESLTDASSVVCWRVI